jgi:hypothetical protein
MANTHNAPKYTLSQALQAGFKALHKAGLKPVLVACLMLATIVLLLVVPFVAATTCGLVIPHEHVLIGRASAQDLPDHEAAETACAAGKPATPAQAGSGRILNVIRIDGDTASPILNMASVLLWLPVLTGVRDPRWLPIRIQPQSVSGSLMAITPSEPPPESS